jgi:hypothetical protein
MPVACKPDERKRVKMEGRKKREGGEREFIECLSS